MRWTIGKAAPVGGLFILERQRDQRDAGLLRHLRRLRKRKRIPIRSTTSSRGESVAGTLKRDRTLIIMENLLQHLLSDTRLRRRINGSTELLKLGGVHHMEHHRAGSIGNW